ncbi:hypothetical protein K474DRAFT_1674149 [Panus rudis PR-1116 ss-1]|nr:hypothetical protein K474DRAFT_1674149 [Panus rudis PR-1116 ss-1]
MFSGRESLKGREKGSKKERFGSSYKEIVKLLQQQFQEEKSKRFEGKPERIGISYSSDECKGYHGGGGGGGGSGGEMGCKLQAKPRLKDTHLNEVHGYRCLWSCNHAVEFRATSPVMFTIHGEAFWMATPSSPNGDDSKMDESEVKASMAQATGRR